MWSVLYRHPDGKSSAAVRRDGSGSAASSSSAHRRLQSAELMDLVDLQDFNVQLARVNDASSIQVFELMNLVTEWMNDSFEHQLENLKYASGKYADFDTVMLLERKERRALLQRVSSAAASARAPRLRRALPEAAEQQPSTSGQLFTAEIKGAALFSRNATQDKIPADVVRFLQESALANKSGLLELVQLSGAAGLGSSVVDLNAFTVTSSSGSSSSSGGGSSSLEAIIIIAVAVAAVAFLFLLVAIFWAWRYDRRNRQAYLAGTHSKEGTTRRSDPTNSQSTIEEHIRRSGHSKRGSRGQAPPSEIGGGDSVLGPAPSGLYPESVISEDISTALSQYYRSGLSYSHSAAGNAGGGAHHPFRASSSSRMDHLNDAASVSSMESYGYSLDGYAPSTATPMPRDVPVATRASAGAASHRRVEADDDDEDYDDESAPGGEEDLGPANDNDDEDADRKEETF